MRAALLLALSVSYFGCGMSALSSAPLSHEECRSMLTHFDAILSEKYGTEREVVSDADVEECVAEQNWNRAGFECAMKAKTKGAIDRCILRS